MLNRRQTGIFCLVAILIGQSLFGCIFLQASFALDVESVIKDTIKNQLPARIPGEPIKVDRKNQKVEDLIPRQDIPYGFAPMIPLNGISISGLGQKAILSLGENYFVVRSNTNATRMCDLYKENRNASKANYVTMDCIAHPYFAFRNRVLAETIKKYILPLMKTLLYSMLKVAVIDYRQADDLEVRTDIECNMAFLSLGLKLIDPNFTVPVLGRVPQLVQSDFEAINAGKPAHSYIMDRKEDFGYYKPIGWYKTNSELISFYKAKTWLSRLNYPINDVTFEADGIKGNNFRRSVLLYRCIELARIDGKPAMDYWMRMVKSMFLLGSQVENWQEKNLYAHDYKSVFKANSTDLKVTLTALAEPLYRTKLLLAVRKQKPVSLGSTSIFDLDEARADRETVACFRFIPSIGYPEDPWLRYAARLYPKPGITTNVFPVALLDLNAWGAPQAANFILDSSWAMDESMPKTITELKRWVLRRSLTGQVQPMDCKIWNLLSPSWRLLPDGIQTALRGSMWANRRLETVFCAWLDSRISIAPLHYAGARNPTVQSVSSAAGSSTAAASSEEQLGVAISVASSGSSASNSSNSNAGKNASASASSNQISFAAKPAVPNRSISGSVIGNSTSPPISHTASTAPGATGISGNGAAAGTVPERRAKPVAVRRAARGHFLDPCPDFYNQLILDIQSLDRDITALGFSFDPALKRELDDYSRMLQRFVKISKDEIECKPLAPQDLSLLGNIDMILDKIDLPVPAVVAVEPQADFSAQASNGSSAEPPAGYTMALGRPGLLYIILMNKLTKEWTLARGAVYTYYEQYGTGLNEETLLNKIDRGTIQPPYWTERFDFVQAEKK